MASITAAAASAMLNATGLASYVGASPLLIIYAGTAPASARAALSGNTVLSTNTCASTPFSSFTDDGSANEVATFGTITNAVAAATGTAVFWRLLKSDGTTVVMQGTCGTSGAELNLNTTAITSGSTVSITSGSIKLPYGP